VSLWPGVSSVLVSVRRSGPGSNGARGLDRLSA
jgi:hypothetical protein